MSAIVELTRLSRPKFWDLVVCPLLICAFGFDPAWAHPFQLDQSERSPEPMAGLSLRAYRAEHRGQPGSAARL